MIGNKKQPFTYSLKTGIRVRYSDLCDRRVYFFLNPPLEALTIEYLYTHFAFQFDSSVASEYRKIERIGITSSVGDGSYDNMIQLGEYERHFDLNLIANSNDMVDIKINLTSLLNKDNCAFRTNTTADIGNHTYIYIDFPIELLDNVNTGDILIWKTDALFTTVGIR